ncbi:MAG: SpoIIE family protein phosphatase [Lachnospiraceae bacterium]|nr:SpoIIE family protein phosphatase [Lachnospiraceae bacterium]
MSFTLSGVNMINVFFIAAGVGVCGLSIMQIRSSTHLEKNVRWYFQVFFLLVEIYILTHLARLLMEGMPGSGIRTALYAVTLVEMISAGVTAFMMSVVILMGSRTGKHERKLQIVLLILLGVHVLFLVVSQFSGAIFYFDEANLYHRGPLYLLSNLNPLIMLLLDAWLLVRYRENMSKRARIAFWVYIIAPVVAIVIQSFSYGIQYIIFATVAAAVFMFFAVLQDLNEQYRQQQESAARISTELDMATGIQASQMPHLFPAFPNRKEFEVYAGMTPAKEVGGDFYDFFLIDEDHICLVMADVSGKGVPAALFMMVARVLIKAHLQNGESPGEALKNVNEQLCEGNEAALFVTVWLAVLEISTGKGVAANAGHEHPALRRADGEYELIVYPHAPALAVMEGIPFKEHSFDMHPGDTLFVYTDGVPEATNAENELLGTERMLQALNREPDAFPETVLKNVMDGIQDFVQGAEQFDDITMLCIRYNGMQQFEEGK